MGLSDKSGHHPYKDSTHHQKSIRTRCPGTSNPAFAQGVVSTFCDWHRGLISFLLLGFRFTNTLWNRSPVHSLGMFISGLTPRLKFYLSTAPWFRCSRQQDATVSGWIQLVFSSWLMWLAWPTGTRLWAPLWDVAPVTGISLMYLISGSIGLFVQAEKSFT